MPDLADLFPGFASKWIDTAEEAPADTAEALIEFFYGE
jgi:hypothetical protein